MLKPFDTSESLLREIVTPLLLRYRKDVEESGSERVACFLQNEWIDRAAKVLEIKP